MYLFLKLFIICIIQQVNSLSNLNIINETAKYDETNSFTINATTMYVILFPVVTNTMNPYRIKTAAKNLKELLPILIVARQETQINSWQLPYMLETTTHSDILYFDSVSHTMCPDDMRDITSELWGGPLKISQSFMVALTTISPENIEVNLTATEEQDFFVKNDILYDATISPSEARYYYYSFNENSSDTVIIEVDSEDDICLTVSVQEASCPVLDSNKDITYEGNYQAINKKGAMTIRKKDFKSGFFIVFVAKPDNYMCSELNSVLPNPTSRKLITTNRTSTLTFKIKNSINRSDYLYSSIGTIVILFIFCIVSGIMMFLFNRFGTISKYKDDIIDNDDEQYYTIDQTGPTTEPQIENLLKSNLPTVNYLAKFPKKDKKRSFNYLWHILSIAIFYSIPVVQLVVTYQRVVNLTGNQDLCYYNFLCAHPSFGFSDFNHIYSNIGYIITGFLFIIITVIRHSKIRIRLDVGIPVHYGLFYAMGVALVIEGILSGCYHICPSQSNYQFDTSFMYVMAVLCMVKLYQNRHPDINATAYSTFTVLGAAIFLAMLGILKGTLAIWIIFVLCYSLLCIYLSFKIYFFSYILEGFKQLQNDYYDVDVKFKIFEPIRKARFIVLLVVNLLNYAMLIAGLVLYSSQSTDFGTFLLALLMGNAIVHAIFYTTMKIVHHEKICFEAIIYGLLAVGTWAAATVFFLDAATLWTVTPAESRQWNQGCIVLNFYDKHDIWHLLSAPALFFTFMFLLSLDDDLINTKQSEIVVF